jgi:hypothetical protein
MLVSFIKIKTRHFFSLLPLPHINFGMPLNTTMLFSFYFYFLILCPVSLLPSSPTLINHLITMNNIIANTQNTVPQLQHAALSEIAKLQQAASCMNYLNLICRGNKC